MTHILLRIISLILFDMSCFNLNLTFIVLELIIRILNLTFIVLEFTFRILNSYVILSIFLFILIAVSIKSNDKFKIIAKPTQLCAICIDDETNNIHVQLKCGHEYHKKCIETWFKNRLDCPCCRYVVS